MIHIQFILLVSFSLSFSLPLKHNSTNISFRMCGQGQSLNSPILESIYSSFDALHQSHESSHSFLDICFADFPIYPVLNCFDGSYSCCCGCSVRGHECFVYLIIYSGKSNGILCCFSGWLEWLNRKKEENEGKKNHVKAWGLENNHMRSITTNYEIENMYLNSMQDNTS